MPVTVEQLAKLAAEATSLSSEQLSRPFTSAESRAIRKGRSQWFPTIFAEPGTPVPEMMASPWRQALMAGLGGAAAGGMGGAFIGKSLGQPSIETKVPGPEGKGEVTTTTYPGLSPSAIGGLVGSLGVGGVMALIAGMRRSARNDQLESLMKRTPVKDDDDVAVLTAKTAPSSKEMAEDQFTSALRLGSGLM